VVSFVGFINAAGSGKSMAITGTKHASEYHWRSPLSEIHLTVLPDLRRLSLTRI
jgi:hypothetical protein